MTHLYEGMFLLDNDLVREGWTTAKSMVTDLLTKHGAQMHTARRWDERRLAYPIAHRKRGTYLLSFFEMPPEKGATLTRDLDLNERILRHLVLRVEAIPETEFESARREDDADFSVPEPPPNDIPSVDDGAEESPVRTAEPVEDDTELEGLPGGSSLKAGKDDEEEE